MARTANKLKKVQFNDIKIRQIQIKAVNIVKKGLNLRVINITVREKQLT